MQYTQVCIESLGYTLPDEIWSSDEIEARLSPLYDRLGLAEGRLELMTGIRERRFWERDVLPSDKSVESANLAIEAAEIDRRELGALLHGSVCRDHLEPATACGVHHRLGLRPDCVVYDVSNACLGLLNGVTQIANMIELGQIRAGLIVGTEGGRQLVETTIDTLNRDTTLTRQSVKSAVASLTIGSGSCAILLTHREISRTENRLLGATFHTATQHHQLCQSGQDEAMASGMQPLMRTDSERLMHEGIDTGATTFERFLREMRWEHRDIQRTFCHQVGVAHRNLLFESLKLNPDNDYPTVQWLGNTGSVALPLTMAIGCEGGFVSEGQNIALLGIGSGINCLMLGASWQASRVKGNTRPPTRTNAESSQLALSQ